MADYRYLITPKPGAKAPPTDPQLVTAGSPQAALAAAAEGMFEIERVSDKAAELIQRQLGAKPAA